MDAKQKYYNNRGSSPRALPPEGCDARGTFLYGSKVITVDWGVNK